MAGSGKTSIGLYRAHYLAEQIQARGRLLNECASVLVVTYTKTLTKALKQLYVELYGEDAHAIAVCTIHEWMAEQLGSRDIRCEMPDADTRDQLVKRALADISRQFPDDRVLRARRLATLQDYQSVSQVGRVIVQ